MTSKPVVVRLPSGAEYGLKSEAEARRVYPNAKIVRYQDGSEYVAPKASTPAKADTAKSEPAKAETSKTSAKSTSTRSKAT